MHAARGVLFDPGKDKTALCVRNSSQPRSLYIHFFLSPLRLIFYSFILRCRLFFAMSLSARRAAPADAIFCQNNTHAL